MRRAARRIRQRWQGKLALALPAAAAAGVASSGGIQHLLQLAQANIKSLAALSGSAVLLVGLCVLFFLLPGIIRGEKRPAPVAAAVHAPGLETGSGSGIPLEIEPTGESSSRPDVLKQQNLRFVLPDGSGLDLLPGTYDVRVAASPIAADGTIYSFDEGVQHLVVTEHGLDPSTPLSLDLSPLAPESTSKEAVDRAYRYAARGGCPGDEAVGLKVAALNRIGVDPF